MTKSNESNRRAQARSLAGAIAWGEGWTQGDVELVAECSNETAEELARTLGRTVYAIQAMRERLGEGPVNTRRSTPASRQAIAWAPDDPRWD